MITRLKRSINQNLARRRLRNCCHGRHRQKKDAITGATKKWRSLLPGGAWFYIYIESYASTVFSATARFRLHFTDKKDRLQKAATLLKRLARVLCTFSSSLPALHEKRYYKQNTHWGAYKQSQRAILSTVNFEIRVLTVSFM